jgi:hypothetical protein
MTESLILDDAPAVLGYGAAITVEPLWDLLLANNVYPASNADFLRQLENPGHLPGVSPRAPHAPEEPTTESPRR